MLQTLAINGGTPVVNPDNAKFIWPIITERTRAAVLKQLEESVSIYNRSGIIKSFEDKFASYHNLPYALLSNSGTNAIWGIYEGLGLGPDDEVILPTYTFFATATPLLQTGATPVFTDCGSDGNIEASKIEAKITAKTKAVMITHMWGKPCDMESIVNLCQKKGVMLLEDCSHAHGATFKGKKVGTFGDAAAWSLQGQKLLTGGEGGIMLTKHQEIYYRAQLLGHYNKRCKQEIPSEHPLSEYALTGWGIKNRSHPLAIAIANEQFEHLDAWIQQKQIFAQEITELLKQYPFLTTPKYADTQPSWYAYVFQFDSKRANGVSIEQFYRALQAEGLVEVDRPLSTSPIHGLKLFTQRHKVFPRLYKNAPIIQSDLEFPEAIKFYKTAIKIPVWVRPEDKGIVDCYISGLEKVCDAVLEYPQAFKV
jgi:dTDP-4-amino-4,6-dideoxygalactose transaminase